MLVSADVRAALESDEVAVRGALRQACAVGDIRERQPLGRLLQQIKDVADALDGAERGEAVGLVVIGHELRSSSRCWTDDRQILAAAQAVESNGRHRFAEWYTIPFNGMLGGMSAPPAPRAQHRVALITGGGTGLGRAAAHQLAADGLACVVTGRRPEPIERVVAECRDAAGVASPSPATSQ